MKLLVIVKIPIWIIYLMRILRIKIIKKMMMIMYHSGTTHIHLQCLDNQVLNQLINKE